MTPADAITAFVTARLDEDEAWARGAGGVHWQWVYNETDEVITPDPTAGEHLTALNRHGDDVTIRMDLCSVERLGYPPETGYGSLPATWPVSYAEEVEASAAGHIIRHAPARVLRQVTFLRTLMQQFLSYEVLRGLAAVWSDHPDYDRGWAPAYRPLRQQAPLPALSVA